MLNAIDLTASELYKEKAEFTLEFKNLPYFFIFRRNYYAI
ncbi:unknown [[Mannheimia] succiniciproducens MBEL55E]|uniref:Uncharacterized protein n=1 Tax=Mannheimia succiniciproducens (strain KCTC 0769BP / MBEL55E) TaxID=221988 RepID=Q65UD9_MANSM|nr:unknown [[Mannheimia] succiniciproducens MBEL55E]